MATIASKAGNRELLDRSIIGQRGVLGVCFLDVQQEERHSIHDFIIRDVVSENCIGQIPICVSNARRTDSEDNVRNGIILGKETRIA